MRIPQQFHSWSLIFVWPFGLIQKPLRTFWGSGRSYGVSERAVVSVSVPQWVGCLFLIDFAVLMEPLRSFYCPYGLVRKPLRTFRGSGRSYSKPRITRIPHARFRRSLAGFRCDHTSSQSGRRDRCTCQATSVARRPGAAPAQGQRVSAVRPVSDNTEPRIPL